MRIVQYSISQEWNKMCCLQTICGNNTQVIISQSLNKHEVILVCCRILYRSQYINVNFHCYVPVPESWTLRGACTSIQYSLLITQAPVLHPLRNMATERVANRNQQSVPYIRSVKHSTNYWIWEPMASVGCACTVQGLVVQIKTPTSVGATEN